MLGIVFDDLDASDGRLEYTLRLRHEVGEDDSWETRDAGPRFQLPGPRITEKLVINIDVSNYFHDKLFDTCMCLL